MQDRLDCGDGTDAFTKTVVHRVDWSWEGILHTYICLLAVYSLHHRLTTASISHL